MCTRKDREHCWRQCGVASWPPMKVGRWSDKNTQTLYWGRTAPPSSSGYTSLKLSYWFCFNAQQSRLMDIWPISFSQCSQIKCLPDYEHTTDEYEKSMSKASTRVKGLDTYLSENYSRFFFSFVIESQPTSWDSDQWSLFEKPLGESGQWDPPAQETKHTVICVFYVIYIPLFFMYSTYFYLFNKIEEKKTHDSCRLPVYNPQRDS